MKKDILNREDVVKLVDEFYTKVQQNEKLGYIFNEVAKIDWVHHLPKMYAFWASALLGEQSFKGNPMLKHILLSKQTTMSEVEFNEWLKLFHETVDELFYGQLANETKFRANNIARNMLNRINNQD